MTYRRQRNKIVMVKLRQPKTVALPIGRAFLARYAKNSKPNLHPNATINRICKR